MSLAATPLERIDLAREGVIGQWDGQDSNLRVLIKCEVKELSPSHRVSGENSVRGRIPGSSTVPQSPRHDSNVRFLLYREAS